MLFAEVWYDLMLTDMFVLLHFLILLWKNLGGFWTQEMVICRVCLHFLRKYSKIEMIMESYYDFVSSGTKIVILGD